MVEGGHQPDGGKVHCGGGGGGRRGQGGEVTEVTKMNTPRPGNQKRAQVQNLTN